MFVFTSVIFEDTAMSKHAVVRVTIVVLVMTFPRLF